jgi:flagellar motility protein MotE (MotC chaperone)
MTSFWSRPRRRPRTAPRRTAVSLALLALVASVKIGVVAHDAVRLARAPGGEDRAPTGAVAEPSHLEPAAGPEDEAPPGPIADHASEDPRPGAGADRSAGPARRLALDRLSQSEFEVLQRLAERRAELEERARQLDRHAALLATAEANLAAQLERLEQLRAEIAAMVTAHDAAEEAKLVSLVKIYETMKPKAAAEIFNRLEMPILISVLERMREAKSADVLARMDPAKARQVTAELARRAEQLRNAGTS